MRMAEMLLQYFHRCGVDYAFGIPAGSINAIYDALYDFKKIKPVIAKHETGAGFMAAGYTRATGKPSICLGSSGPGATNFLTAAAHCYQEKLPVIFVTGSVPTTVIGKGGAQELDALPLYQSITKENAIFLSPEESLEKLPQLIRSALEGVQGPVHISIPLDIQMKDVSKDLFPLIPNISPLNFNEKNARLALQIIRDAKGCIFAGNGTKKAKDELILFAERTGWPVITTPRGKGSFPENHPLSLGVYGLAGNEEGMQYVNSTSCDTILVIGSSLGEAATSNWNPQLTAEKQVIHVDIDVSEFNKAYPADLIVEGDSYSVLRFWNNCFRKENSPITFPLAESAVAREQETKQHSGSRENSISDYVKRFQALLPGDTIYYMDIGGFMNFFIRDLKVTAEQSFNIDLKFGAMGSGIGSAIGLKLAEPDKTVVSVTGDGCFFMHGMEVLTAKEYSIPVVFIVFNDARLGMVYHGHMLQYKRSLPDFCQKRVDICEMAKSMGIKGIQINSPHQITHELIKNMVSLCEPLVIEILIDGHEMPPMGERVKFLQSFQ